MNIHILSDDESNAISSAKPYDWEGQDRRTIGDRRQRPLDRLKELYPEKYDKAKRRLKRDLGEDNMKQMEDAFHAVAPALMENRLHIFFSYKLIDQDAASRVTSALQRFSGRSLDIQLASKFQKGGKYKEEIHKEIEQANWFLLLLPDPSVDWDWCLYETGMFRRGFRKGAHRIVCLHHPLAKVPEQISEFLSVPAKEDNIKAFLKELYIKDNPIPGMDALAPHIAEKDLENLACDIRDAIVPPGNMRRLTRYVVLEIDQAGQLNDHTDLADARIIETDQRTCDVFGKEQEVKTWGILTQNVVSKTTDYRWLQELGAVIRKAACGDTFRPVQATFEELRGGKVFRPVLVSAQAPLEQGELERTKRFEVIFVEEIGSNVVRHVPPRLNALFTALILAYRFRWEVIERFGVANLDQGDLVALEQAMRRLENEAASRGVLDPELLCENFEEPVAMQIREIFGDWEGMRTPDETGELDLAMKNEDLVKLRALLSRLAGLNRRFIKLATGMLETLSE